jgi:multiple sugar transport system permease protein
MGPAESGTRLVLLLFFGVFFGLPLLWLLLAPTKTDNQLLELSPLAFGSFARVKEAWQNLLVFEHGVVVKWAFNSVYYTLTSLVLSIVITVPAGYALGTAKFAGRKPLLWATLITMILPGSALVLPLFLEMNLFHLVNKPWSVILPAAFFPFGVYLAYIFYSVSLPADLLAAARVDGCSELQLFWYLGIPLARSLLGLLTFLSFTGNWNNYFLPFVMLNASRHYNLPVGIQILMAGTNALRPTLSASDLPIHRAEVATAGVATVLPVVLVFVFAQRFLVTGILSGTLKE